uniref:hypothetical protein n=1 Tax=Mariniflexile maritimum TaxID=2682493 RepID=UPI0018DBB0A6
CHSDSDFVLQVHANDFKEIKIPNISKIVFGSFIFFQLAGNGLQLPEGGDLEALHCQPSRNFDRSTKLDLTTEPPLLGRCC